MALRARSAPEPMIAVVVREVEASPLRDDTVLERELGTPEDYAAALVPDAPVRRRTGPVMIGGIVAAVVWLALVHVGDVVGWHLRDTLGPLASVPALVLLFLGVFGQFLSDYARRPGDS
ncbi:hypothetical protein [Isoptericola sp. NPDC060257]|uniref:hypothetical protein n=1 Tax=Isoptericola sp. NPDC060257 TaxID=3347087 RepID=UPI00364902F4